MKITLISVRDRVAGSFCEPKAFVNLASAQRWFRHVCKENPDGADFALFNLGEFESDDGVIHALENPEFVENGVDKGE